VDVLTLIVELCGFSVVEYGDEISPFIEEESVLLANHQSTADTPLVMLVLWNKGHVAGNVLWIMDRIFRFTNFGIISSIRADFFIKQVRKVICMILNK
jgi:lysophosphatidylglycerol acyltransferase 1